MGKYSYELEQEKKICDSLPRKRILESPAVWQII